MYFRLLPEVYLVIGKNKSLLQNIITKRCLWIDSHLSNIIKLCEQNEPFEEKNRLYLEELCKNGWGRITQKPIFVDKIRLTNVFNEKKFHKDIPIIESAVIKITNTCNLNCPQCGKSFCPTCFKNTKASDQLSLSEYKDIVLKLKKYGCLNISITGGEAALSPYFFDICEFIVSNELKLTINTNGLVNLHKLNKDAFIIVSLFSLEFLSDVINNLQTFSNVLILDYCSLDHTSKSLLPKDWKLKKGFMCTPKIDKSYLINMDINSFFLKKEKNKCLNSKITILENGDVYPCFGAIDKEHKIGNIKQDKWNCLIKDLSQRYWLHKIDNHPHCKHCEFKYACDSCMFMDIEKNCCYNMEAGLWK